MKREFFQSHSCEGFSAKVTIEWSTPDNVELPAARAELAEEIADCVMGEICHKPRHIVHAMRRGCIEDPPESCLSG